MKIQAQLRHIFSDFIDYFDPHLFDPHWYIGEFYPRHIGEENLGLIESNIEISRQIRVKTDSSPLSFCDLGGGGTLWAEMIYGIHVNTIYYTDFLSKNRKVVEDYIKHKHDPYWDQYIQKVIEIETVDKASIKTVFEHASEIKNKIQVAHCDVFDQNPIGIDRKFDIVIANFVMESVTSDYAKWVELMKNAESIVGSNGFFVVAAIEQARGYSSDSSSKLQPATNITIKNLEDETRGLGYDVFYSNLIPAMIEHRDQYAGLAVVAGQKID